MHYQGVNHRRLLIALVATIAVFVVKPARAANVTRPGEAVVRRAIDSMRQLASTSDSAARGAILDTIDRSLAIDALARAALGSQWDKLSRTERAQFVGLFTQALEKLAYPRAAKALATLDVNYLGEDTGASGHLVRTVLLKKDGSKIGVNYTVGEEAGRWRISDVELDGESLSHAVSARIQAAIKQDGYPKLVTDLSRRVERADSEPGAK